MQLFVIIQSIAAENVIKNNIYSPTLSTLHQTCIMNHIRIYG